ncbi:MAG: hypothetical protein V3T77_01750, partial [Planctomycetota bacterium]
TYARLRELARSHRTTVRDRVRVQARLKARKPTTPNESPDPGQERSARKLRDRTGADRFLTP